MKVMSTPYVSIGRTNQKNRTRDALVVAARELVAAGQTPTVEAAAAAASISRTTAYRYFPNQRALLVAAHPETERASLLPPGISDDPEARIKAVVEAFTLLIADTDLQQRTMLRLALDPDTPRHEPGLLRQGRAIAWFEEALEPLRGRLTDDELRRLVFAIRSTTGIEARIWLTDVAGLSSDEAIELMRWSAKALFRAALADPPTPVTTWTF